MIKTKHETAALGERKLGTPTTVSRNCTPIKVLTFEHINEAEVARMDAKPHKLDLLFYQRLAYYRFSPAIFLIILATTSGWLMNGLCPALHLSTLAPSPRFFAILS